MNDADILVVEDNDDDLHFTLTALRKNVTENIAIARDGAEALDYLFCRGKFAERSRDKNPRLVLLDLKLPKVDGFEVLAQMRANVATMQVPVVVLTSSSRKADVEAAYKAGANSYLVKSVDFREFTKEIQQVGAYWLSLNRI